jgi:hypothetical protein
VITPYQQAGETPQEETGVLVREMIHASLMSFQPIDKDVQPWANEGIARVIADLYQPDGNPVPASHDFGPVITAVRALPGNYRTGTLPGTQQLYGGTVASRADWDAVAASVYAYIAEKYGMSNMLGSADLLGTIIGGPGTPPGHVFKLSKNGKITYYPASTISSGWRKWLQDPALAVKQMSRESARRRSQGGTRSASALCPAAGDLAPEPDHLGLETGTPA